MTEMSGTNAAQIVSAASGSAGFQSTPLSVSSMPNLEAQSLYIWLKVLL